MALGTPDWLARRGGRLAASTLPSTWLVFLGDEPQYRLRPFPVSGKFGCQISQTVNGRRLDGPETWASPDDAVSGGLEQLRQALGW